jgi:hypothetical protein
MLATFKRLGAFALSGAILGMLAVSLLAPSFITWYVTPGVQGQALCNCPKLAHSVIGQLLEAQLVGAIVGAILFLVVGVLFGRSRKRAVPPAAPGPADAPPAA